MAKPTFLSKLASVFGVSKHYDSYTPYSYYDNHGKERTFFSLRGNYFNDWNASYNSHDDFRKYLNAYGENPLLYMIVKKIAFNSASIKRVAVNENGDEIENSQVLDLLENPNSEQGQIEFLEYVNEYLNLTGNVFIRYIQGIGAGQELQALETDGVDIICNSRGDILYYEYTTPSGSLIRLEVEEVLHIKTSNVVNSKSDDIKYGLSPLQAAWVIIKSSSEKFNAEASIFKNRGIIGILTNRSDVPMLPKDRERLQKEFDREVGGSDRYNKIKISSTDLSYIQTGMSPTDLKLLEGIVSSLRQLCAIFGMPSVLFNDNDNSTYNNVHEAKVTAYNDVYIPLADKINEDLTKFINEKLGTTDKIVNDLNSIEEIKASQNEVLQAINQLDASSQRYVFSQMTADEVRMLIGLNELQVGDKVIGLNASGNGQGEVESPEGQD